MRARLVAICLPELRCLLSPLPPGLISVGACVKAELPKLMRAVGGGLWAPAAAFEGGDESDDIWLGRIGIGGKYDPEILRLSVEN